MKIIETEIPEVKIFCPTKFSDSRGYFSETFIHKEFLSVCGNYHFVQDNESFSHKNVLRGLHYQLNNPQGKLVRAVMGEVFDVAVDIRKSSPTFGKYVSVILNEENSNILWIPPGFAHGFLALKDFSKIEYKVTDYYCKEDDFGINYHDPSINIKLFIDNTNFILSDKDKQHPYLHNAEVFD